MLLFTFLLFIYNKQYKNTSWDINHLTAKVDFAYLRKHVALLYFSSNPLFGTILKHFFGPQPITPHFWQIQIKILVINGFPPKNNVFSNSFFCFPINHLLLLNNEWTDYRTDERSDKVTSWAAHRSKKLWGFEQLSLAKKY